MNDSSTFSPKARSNRLVTQELPDEVLIYNLETNKAYCLNQTAAFVWQHSDGQTPVRQIAYLLQKRLRAPVDEAVIWFALENLEKDGLLENKINAPSVFAGMTRRQLIIALGKSAAIAIPLVFSIAAPSAASARSGLLPNGVSCATTAIGCQSDICSSDTGNCCSSYSGQRCASNVDCCSGGEACISGSCQTPSGGFGCVLYDTPITTASGSVMRAQDVAVGQMLLGVNCINGETIAGRVKHIMKKSTSAVYSIIAENGAVLNCSPSHDIIEGFGDTSGKRAEQFRIGDALLVYDQKSGKIVEMRTAAINYAEFFQPVLIFEMDTKEHTFISGGILSHNKFIV